MFDANIFMVGIENKTSDPNCSFANMKELYLIPLFESFKEIIVHQKVYNELDEERKNFVNSYKNVTIVDENNLYGLDPKYTTIFNNIARCMDYERHMSKDQGEVYSLAYAAFHNINYFCCKEIKIDYLSNELIELKDVQVITFDIIVLLAFIYYNSRKDMSHNKALKAIYKRYCEDVIKRHKLPQTLKEYFLACQNYI